MCPLLSDCQVFAKLVEEYFGFLEEYGFKRFPEHDVALSTLCEVAYLGKYVAFEIYLDIRDDYIGVNVSKAGDGSWEEEVRTDLGTFLKRLGCFRRPPARQLPSSIESALAAWADLLQLYSEKILAGSPNFENH